MALEITECCGAAVKFKRILHARDAMSVTKHMDNNTEQFNQ